MREVSAFFIVVNDDDRREFSVHGPMKDDTRLNALVSKAQDSGRHVNCRTSYAFSERGAVDEAERRWPTYKRVGAVVSAA